LLLLVVVVAIVAPSALSGGSIKVVSALAGLLALASFGQMLIIMIGALDFSVPAILAFSAGVVVHFGVEGSNTTLVIIAAVAVAVLISTVNGALIALLRLNALIVTMATFGIVSGLLVVWTGVSFSVTGEAPTALQSVGQWSVVNISLCFLVAIVASIILAFVLTRTRAGRQIARVGSNRRAARALGVRTATVEIATFAGAGLFYGVTGVLLAGFIGTPDASIGSPYQLLTITAVAIAGVLFSGGPASVSAVLAASIFLQLLDQAMVVIGLSSGIRVIVQGAVLIIAIAVITLGQNGFPGINRSKRSRSSGPEAANETAVLPA